MQHASTQRIGMLTLALAAFVWTVIGLSIALGYTPSPAGAPHLLIPTPVRVSFWAVPAALAVASIITGRWIAWTCGALMLAPVVRIGSYLVSWGSHLAGEDGSRTGWYVALLHLALPWLVIIVALLTRPDKQETPR